jgi:hypothetical protein
MMQHIGEGRRGCTWRATAEVVNDEQQQRQIEAVVWPSGWRRRQGARLGCGRGAVRPGKGLTRLGLTIYRVDGNRRGAGEGNRGRWPLMVFEKKWQQHFSGERRNKLGSSGEKWEGSAGGMRTTGKARRRGRWGGRTATAFSGVECMDRSKECDGRWTVAMVGPIVGHTNENKKAGRSAWPVSERTFFDFFFLI